MQQQSNYNPPPPQYPQPPVPPQLPPQKKQPSITIKLLVICLLIVILVIPWILLELLIYDRERTSETAINEVSQSWSSAQTVSGPTLHIPFKTRRYNEDKQLIEATEWLTVLPEDLAIDGKVSPEIRYRGIYEVVVYSAQLQVKGKLNIPDIGSFGIDSSAVIWKEVYLSLGLSDMRGIRDEISVNWNGNKIEFNPGMESSGKSGVSVRLLPDGLPKNLATENTFAFDLGLNGSRSLSFEPLGKTTLVHLASPWKNPSFNGSFLPDDRKITETGFSADWKVLHLNRNFPQAWKNQDFYTESSSFGVELMVPVDHYTKSSRASKYAILIITLTFLVYFFVEVLNKTRIHPFQYILVGLAICVFYTLLLSFSEHMNFNLAYLLAAGATIGAITVYSAAIFKNRKATLLSALILLLIYGFVFVIIQLQDYALLVGSIGLFLTLIIIMYLSRKIKWYGDEEQGT